MATNHVPPAKGEDNALQGFTSQYLVAAELIIQALDNSNFEYAILKDFRAEKVDDIQIVFKQHVDAYQVKWHEPTTSLTLSDVKGSDKKPENGLLKQLADGWQSLSGLYESRKVVVHLHTSSYASTSQLSDISSTESPPRHLAEFISTYWSDENTTEETIRKWKPIIQKLQKATGLSSENFEQFRLHCRFDLNRRHPQGREGYDPSNRNYKDVEHLKSQLLRLAGEQRGKITLTRQDIIKLANWGERFEFKARHEFITTAHYVPIGDTVQKLEELLQAFNQGYLALLGTPGSGKSTLLTKVLRYRRNVHVIRYYCFVPDDSALSIRGEAFNFLHDLVLRLWNDGIRPLSHTMGDTIEQLRSTFQAQLQEINNQWKEKEIRTIILVDGLDHIKRESNPERSLLNELPLPPNVPEGCIFVLGSQHLELIDLNTRVLQHLKVDNSGRILTMEQLSRRNIHKIISLTLPEISFSNEDLNTIVERSTGHPLALGYILNRVRDAVPEEVKKILEDLPEYADNIEKEYGIYWQHLKSDDELRELLALLSRMRGILNIDLALKLANQETVRRLISNVKHYFKELPNQQWKFFHNSFRQFILDKTGRSPFGIEDEDTHKEFHNKLARLAEESSTLKVFQWEQLFHTFHSGNFEKVLEIATQQFFRNQFFESRPLRLILEDTMLLIRAAKECGDALSVFRALLIESELNARDQIVNEIDFPSLLFDIGKYDESIKYSLFENQLLIEPTKALYFSCDLADAGYFEIAADLFEAAEPLKELMNLDSSGVTSLPERDALWAWVDAAVRFRSIEEIKEVIDSMEAEDHSYRNQDKEEATKELRHSLYIHLIDAILELENDSKLESLLNVLSESMDEQIIRRRIASFNIYNKTDRKLLDEDINYLLSLNENSQLSDNLLMRLADLLITEKNDIQKASILFESITAPKSVVDSERTTDGFNPYIKRLRYYRLKAALGNPIEPAVAVAGSTQGDHRGYIFIERMVIRMANLWGLAWQGNILTPTMVERELLPAIRLVERWDDQELRFAFAGKLKQYLEVLIYTASAHNLDSLSTVSKLLERRWDDETTAKYWSNSIKRSVALTIHQAGGSKEELVARLDKFEPEYGAVGDVHEFLEGCEEHARAWADIDMPERAQRYISPIVKLSYGIYQDKDSQIDYWTDWYTKILKKEPEIAKQYLQSVSEGVATVSICGRGSSNNAAIITLLSAIIEYDPSKANNLKYSFWAEHVNNFLTTIESFLIATFADKSVRIEIPLVVLRRLYIPYIRHFESAVVMSFIDRLVDIQDESYAVEILNDLIEKIELETSPKLCGRWWGKLDEYIKRYPGSNYLNNSIETKLSENKPESHYSKSSVTLTDDTIIEEDELINQAKNPERLIYILDNLKKDNFYSIERLINPVVAELNIEQIEKIVQILLKLGKGDRGLTKLLMRLNKLGNTEQAEKYALDALKISDSYGWSYSYDGGSRLGPYKVLIEINDKYREQACTQYIDDLLQGYRSFHLVGDLENTVFLFWENPPLCELWREFYEHFSQLREFSHPVVSFKSDFEAVESRSIDKTEALVKLIFDAYEMQQPEFREDAFKALSDLILLDTNTHKVITKKVTEYLQLNSEFPLLGITLIKVFYENDINLDKEIYELVHNHLKNDDMSVRMGAKKVLSIIGQDHSVKHNKRFPAAYSMVMPEFSSLEDTSAGALIKPDDTLFDTMDSLQLVDSIREPLETIHKHTGIPFRNLVERSASLMKVVLPEDEWNKEAEKKISNRARALGIETSYRRPRALAAFLALGYVVAELYDSDKLDDNDIYLLEPSLSMIDYALSHQEPIALNLSPADITISDGSRKRVREWAEEIPEIITSSPIMADGSNVLGFVSKAEIPTWEKPFKHIVGCICSPKFDKQDVKYIPESIIMSGTMGMWWKADLYPSLPYLKTALSRVLLIRGSSQRVELGRSSWLALNPIIANNLGWQFSQDGLFRWVNDQGEIMVESQWWRTGRLNRHPYEDGIRAEGWLVKASPNGMEELKSSIMPAKWVHGVKKTYKYEKEEYVSDWIEFNELT